MSAQSIGQRVGLPEELKEGLVLYLPGSTSGTTAFDASGNGNNGTLVNSPVKTRGGLWGYEGWTFNGTTQSITFPNLNGIRSFSAIIIPSANNKTIANLGGGATITLNASNQIATAGLTGAQIFVNGTTVNSVTLNRPHLITVNFDSYNTSSGSFANSSFAGRASQFALHTSTVSFDLHRDAFTSFFTP